MTDYLLDTNIVSASSPTKSANEHHLLRWIEKRSVSIHLSAITVAEIAAGAAKLRREQPGQRARGLADWLDALIDIYGDRILPVDVETARRAGEFVDVAKSLGHQPGLADATIAATASLRGFTVVTRNIRHFQVFGVPLINPFDEAPTP